MPATRERKTTAMSIKMLSIKKAASLTQNPPLAAADISVPCPDSRPASHWGQASNSNVVNPHLGQRICGDVFYHYRQRMGRGKEEVFKIGFEGSSGRGVK